MATKNDNWVKHGSFNYTVFSTSANTFTQPRPVLKVVARDDVFDVMIDDAYAGIGLDREMAETLAKSLSASRHRYPY